MTKKYYITAAIPYVNGKPHIGHALEFIQTDTIARYHRLLGKDVIALSGGDENALKNVQAAEKAGIPVQKFVDTNTEIFYQLTKKLNAKFDIWQKGSDIKHHFPASQKLWLLCRNNGDIYQKNYKGLYCVGCEVFYTQDELDEKGECVEHPGKKLDEVEETNYFFRLSKYEDFLIDLIENNKFEIVPQKRKNEVLTFLKKGLEDISISRSNERAKNWGVPVPDDPTQRIYVWFDALNIYQSGIGFGWNEEKYRKFWPADLHVIGKGILRFHAIYWPALLKSAGLELPKQLFVHEYFTVNGQKMGKSLGNVIDPGELVKKYSADSLRYYFWQNSLPLQTEIFPKIIFKQSITPTLPMALAI
jgi:methionyl-tRNA synthetase